MPDICDVIAGLLATSAEPAIRRNVILGCRSDTADQNESVVAQQIAREHVMSGCGFGVMAFAQASGPCFSLRSSSWALRSGVPCPSVEDEFAMLDADDRIMTKSSANDIQGLPQVLSQILLTRIAAQQYRQSGSLDRGGYYGKMHEQCPRTIRHLDDLPIVAHRLEAAEKLQGDDHALLRVWTKF